MTHRSPDELLAMWETITSQALRPARRRAFLSKLKRQGSRLQLLLPDDELERLGRELFERTGALRLDDWAADALQRSRELDPPVRGVIDPDGDRGRRRHGRQGTDPRDPSLNPSYRNDNSIQKRIPSASGRPSQSDEPLPLNRDKQPKGPRYVKRFSGGAPVYPEKTDRELHRRIGNINDHDG